MQENNGKDLTCTCDTGFHDVEDTLRDASVHYLTLANTLHVYVAM